MVNARIHIICGNCGDNSMLEWELTERWVNEGEPDQYKEKVPVIGCRNCSTLHFIDNVLPRRKEKQTND